MNDAPQEALGLLPRGSGHADRSGGATTRLERETASTDAAGTVLVVDDDDDIRECVASLLEDEGYSVAVAADGAQALAYLAAAPLPCLVLLDLMMPGVDGWSVMAAMQRDPSLASVPVVVVSASGKGCLGMLDAGAAAALQKPVSLDVLIDAVEQHRRRSVDEDRGLG